MFYIKLTANSCQIFIILNLQLTTTQRKVAPSDQRNAKGFLMNFSTIIAWRGWLFVLILNIQFKQLCKRIRFHVRKTSFHAICKPLPLNQAEKFKIKKEISLVRKLRLWTYKSKLPCKLLSLYIASESSLKNVVDRRH